MAQIGLPGGEVDDVTERVLGSSAGRGSSIEPGLRGRLEGALGADLSDVRLHAGSQAADLNRRMSATAFTYGRDIYFRDGTPDTGTDQGLHLLAHELTHTVQQGAAPIRRSPGPSVIRRRLFVDGRWYGPEDEKELTDHEKGRAGGQLPKWTDKLQEKKDYTYDEGLGDWMSVSSSMTFYKGATKSTVDSFGGDVLDKAGVRKTEPGQNEAKDQNSKGPRHPVRRTVSKVRLFKFSKETGAHWTLECEVDGGEGAKTGVKHMKIDLMNAGYRIFYGGRKQEPTKISDETVVDLESPTPVLRLYQAFIRIAEEKGPRTGSGYYNCQDFALAMLKELKVMKPEVLANEEAVRVENQKAGLGIV
jgi:hypothetical protein